MKKSLLLLSLISYGNIWSGHNMLNLWHESDVVVTSKFGVGTEFLYDLRNKPKNVEYGYVFGYYHVNNNLRIAVGVDYQGSEVTQLQYNLKLGKQ